MRAMRSTSRRSSRHAVMPPCRYASGPVTPTAPASSHARSASSSSRPTTTIGCCGRASQASARAEPGAQRGDRDRAGDVRLVELQLGAHVDDERAGVARGGQLARVHRLRHLAIGAQRPAVERDDRLEVRRLRRQPGDRPRDERVLVVDAQQRAVGPLVADRRGDLQVHPRPAAQRAAEMPGPDLAVVGQRRAAPRAGSETGRARPRPCRRPGPAARRRRRTGCRR